MTGRLSQPHPSFGQPRLLHLFGQFAQLFSAGGGIAQQDGLAIPGRPGFVADSGWISPPGILDGKKGDQKKWWFWGDGLMPYAKI